MNINGFNTVRVTDLARGTGAMNRIGRTQAALDRVQLQLSTGRRLLRPSDDAGDAAAAQQLRKTLELRAAHETNLNHSSRFLADTDTVLGDVTDLLREARNLAAGKFDTGVASAERQGAAVALRGIESQLLTLANKRFGGMSLFGGTNDRDPYVSDGGGIRFVGSDRPLTNAVGENVSLAMLASGPEIFGGPSQRVGTAELSPALLPTTRLADAEGARGQGIDRGSFRITNGALVADIDLSDADSFGDVINRINASGIGVTASLGAGGSIQLSGATITVTEAGGTTAADLGLLQPSGATITGDSVQPTISVFTPLSALRDGAGIDTAGGLTITNGTESDTVSLAGMSTVGDLLDRLNNGTAHVRADISLDGHSLTLRNPVQGTDLRVAEGTGTTTADLGWLTFTANDSLSDLNNGRGLRLDPLGPDLQLTDTGAVQFDVDLDGTGTVQDVINAINTAAAGAGASLVATFDPTTPGIVLSNVQKVASLGESQAGQDLGFDAPISAGVLTGRDVNPVTSEGIFGHLRQLIRALDSGDTVAGERALASLESDETQVVLQRGDVGARLQEVDARLERLDDANLVVRDMLSRLEDVDFSAAIMEFQTLQTSLQASLQTTSQLMGTTLFDFLR